MSTGSTRLVSYNVITHHPWEVRRGRTTRILLVRLVRMDAESRVGHTELDPTDEELRVGQGTAETSDVGPVSLHEGDTSVELDGLRSTEVVPAIQA
jgi:hypothetical protein